MKKLSALILALAMIASMSVVAYAEEEIADEAEVVAEEVANYDDETMMIDEEEVAEEVAEEVVEEVVEEAAEEVVEEVVVTEIGVSTASITVDGEAVEMVAYEINDNNYFKLRDIAMAVAGSDKEFAVDWDAEAYAITLTSASTYEVVGGEMEIPEIEDGAEIEYATSTATIMADEADVEIAGFEIAGNNYYKLRDVASVMDFDVSWDAETETILIDTTASYIDDEAVAEEVVAEEVVEEEVIEEEVAEEVTEEEVVEEEVAEEVTEEEVVEEVVEYDEVAALRATIIEVAAAGYGITIEESELAEFTTVEELYAYADERAIYWGEGN